MDGDPDAAGVDAVLAVGWSCAGELGDVTGGHVVEATQHGLRFENLITGSVMRRLLPFSLPILLLATGIAACGSDEGGALDTLPVIRTTTSTTTTSTVPDARRKFYEVKAGDNIADIARSFQVPRSEIVRINNLADDGAIIQIGQILEIPTDVVLVDTLPEIGATSSTELP